MIRWIGPAVTSLPGGEITLDECRNYIGAVSRNDKARQDSLLDTLRASIPLIFESKLNRAMFPQQRRVQVEMEDHQIRMVSLEPNSNLEVRRGDNPANLEVVPVEDYVSTGTNVYFKPLIRVRDLTFLQFNYTAGFDPLPEDLKEAMLWAIHRGYERHAQTINDSGEVVINARKTSGEIPQSVMNYLVTHDAASLAGGY